MTQLFARPDLYDENWALDRAIEAARKSPCQKSQRGVVVWREGWPQFSVGWNHQPAPFSCDGSEQCRANCAKLCVHAEAHALFGIIGSAVSGPQQADMLHVKVVDGGAVPSGNPSCWQCSRHILSTGIRRMWLLHKDGLQAYSAREFHELTLQKCGLL